MTGELVKVFIMMLRLTHQWCLVSREACWSHRSWRTVARPLAWPPSRQTWRRSRGGSGWGRGTWPGRRGSWSWGRLSWSWEGRAGWGECTNCWAPGWCCSCCSCSSTGRTQWAGTAQSWLGRMLGCNLTQTSASAEESWRAGWPTGKCPPRWRGRPARWCCWCGRPGTLTGEVWGEADSWPGSPGPATVWQCSPLHRSNSAPGWHPWLSLNITFLSQISLSCC